MKTAENRILRLVLELMDEDETMDPTGAVADLYQNAKDEGMRSFFEGRDEELHAMSFGTFAGLLDWAEETIKEGITVNDYFMRMAEVLEPQEDFATFPITSACGADCRKAIDAYVDRNGKTWADVCKMAFGSGASFPIEEGVLWAICGVFYFG